MRPYRATQQREAHRVLVLERTNSNRALVLFGVMTLAAMCLVAMTALRAGAFEYLDIPENCQTIDDMNPFPDLTGWSLVEEQDMGVMEDNSIRMCRRKTFMQDDSNRRLYVVYFKGEPELYWYNLPESASTAKKGSMSDIFSPEEPEDPTKASDYREQSKQNFDMGFGVLKF